MSAQGPLSLVPASPLLRSRPSTASTRSTKSSTRDRPRAGARVTRASDTCTPLHGQAPAQRAMPLGARADVVLAPIEFVPKLKRRQAVGRAVHRTTCRLTLWARARNGKKASES